MADVLLGRTDGIEGFERHVVLKRIRPEHAKDQRFIRMFLDEARVAANLHHQHIVQVHDIGESAGEYFIAMEYIHGEDVRTILSNASKTRAHVPLSVALAIVSAAAAGLHYAHERRGADKRSLGIVHRDISPSNILVGYDGSIKIVDFGIAKASMRQETRSGHLKGKISYMSPEQCKGSEVDRRSDVYSLGVVLYELATTTRLFKGESDYLVMDQIVNGRVSLPQVRRPELPNELSAIMMRAIAPDAERRYFTADELRVALDQFAAKAGLATATSAVGAYLRKQFGERPEPWLELDGRGDYSFDDVQLSIGETPPSKSWTELSRDDPGRRSSANVIARRSGPIGVIAASDAAAQAIGGQRQTAVRQPSTPSPTDSKMGWESQRPPRAPRGFTPAKLAMISAPLIAILGVAIWRLAGTGSSESPAALAAARPAAAPPAGPVVTPIPEPPRAPAAVAAASDTPPPAAAPVRPPEPSAAASRSHTASVTAKRTTVAKLADTAPAATAPPVSKVEAPAAPPPVSAAPTSPVTNPPPPPAAPAITAPAVAAPAVAAPPPPPQALAQATTPQNVTQTALDANRIAGDKDIVPDESTQHEISQSNLDKISGAYKLCITVDGAVDSVTQLKSTGFPAYDFKIQNTIRARWRYRPYVVNGKRAPVCTAVRFVYSQK